MEKMFKGFNSDLTCRGFQFKEGKEYHEEEAKLCEKGFHACEDPLDCFNYYGPSNSVYHVVEMDDVSDERTGDSKRVAKSIRIGAKLSIKDIVDAHFEYVKSHVTNENNAKKGEPATAGYKGAATAGYKGAATAGYKGAATAGYKGAATAGDYGAATAGDSGAATAGDSGAATAGDYGAATAGYKGAATAGDSGAATAGDYGAATARGSVTVGKNGVATVRGNEVRARGGMGAILTLAEENEGSYDIRFWKTVVIDGDKYKPDTWYRLNNNGEITEAGLP